MSKFTQEQLEEMSGEELSILAAEIRFKIVDSDESLWMSYYSKAAGDLSKAKVGYLDYTKDWEHCGELMEELCVSGTVLSQGVSIWGEYTAYSREEKGYIIDQPYKRGITITYILVKQGEVT